LLLFHPVHGCGTVVHFTNLVVHTRVEKDALGRGGFAGVDVGRDADVSIALDRGLAGHGGITPIAGKMRGLPAGPCKP
jgi:hypothetical protein